MRLGVIADIGEEYAGLLLDEQQPRTACKPAKITDVGKMTNEKCIETRGSKMLPKLLLAYTEVHCWECNRRAVGSEQSWAS